MSTLEFLWKYKLIVVTIPGRVHQQTSPIHVLDLQAALRVPRRTSQLYDKTGQHLYPNLCENELVQIDFWTRSAVFGIHGKTTERRNHYYTIAPLNKAPHNDKLGSFAAVIKSAIQEKNIYLKLEAQLNS